MEEASPLVDEILVGTCSTTKSMMMSRIGCIYIANMAESFKQS